MNRPTKTPENDPFLIALDLDGTLLTDSKELSPKDGAALERAAAGGWIVPATGRLHAGLPAVIRKLPYIRYVIASNGAQVLDTQTMEVLYRQELSVEDALPVLRRLDELPAVYDCFQNGWGWMDWRFYPLLGEYVGQNTSKSLLLSTRTFVRELPDVLKKRRLPLQKIQAFFRDPEDRNRAIETLNREFPAITVTSSLSNNLEINSRSASKGDALCFLRRYLNVSCDRTIAFGDGTNDVSMLLNAGIGVAMGNAALEAKQAAKFITDTNNENGVAKALDSLLPMF